MQIESIIQRHGGTHVELDGVNYHFKPDQPGQPHIAAVDDERHIERLLSITEGFRAADAKPAAQPVPETAETPNAAQVLQGDGDAGVAGEVSASPAVPRAKRGRKPKAAQPVPDSSEAQ